MNIDELFLNSFSSCSDYYLSYYKDEIIKKFYEIIKRAYNNKKGILQILECLKDIPEIREQINSRPDFILKCCLSCEITKMFEVVGDIESIKKIKERKFDTKDTTLDKSESVDDIIISKLTEISVLELKEERILPFIKELLNEILKYERLNIGDIEYKASGTTSTVYRVGSVVFKFGEDRGTPKIPSHPNILHSILRIAIPKYKNEGVVKDTFLDKDKLMFIEIQPYISSDMTIPISNGTCRTLKEFLRQKGIIFGDPIKENIVVVRDFDNIRNYHGINYLDPKGAGILENNNNDEEVYEENGNRVLIIDADDIYIKENNDDDGR